MLNLKDGICGEVFCESVNGVIEFVEGLTKVSLNWNLFCAPRCHHWETNNSNIKRK